MKFSTAITLSSIAVAAVLPEWFDAHAFLLLPKAEITVSEKNLYAYVVPGEKIPPLSTINTGETERNAKGFTANYKKLNPPSLKEFILKNEEPSNASTVKPGGTAECGYSNPNATPQPIPDHVEFGNYKLDITQGLHPGPCEAWCDDEIVIPLTEDCRTLFQKPIPYAKDKCVGKSRFTFYWLATHSPPFQVYIGCAPLQGGSGNGTAASNGGTSGGNRNSANSTSSGTTGGISVPTNGGGSGNTKPSSSSNTGSNKISNGQTNNINSSNGKNSFSVDSNSNGGNSVSKESSSINNGGNSNNRNNGAVSAGNSIYRTPVINKQSMPQGNTGFGRALDFSDLDGM